MLLVHGGKSKPIGLNLEVSSVTMLSCLVSPTDLLVCLPDLSLFESFFGRHNVRGSYPA